MRLIIKNMQQPDVGDTRIKSSFLWLPKKIKNEWRWLEWARFEQQCIRRTQLFLGYYSPGQYQKDWINIAWID